MTKKNKGFEKKIEGVCHCTQNGMYFAYILQEQAILLGTIKS